MKFAALPGPEPPRAFNTEDSEDTKDTEMPGFDSGSWASMNTARAFH